MVKVILTTILICLLAGCGATGFDRGVLKSQMPLDGPVVTQQDIVSTLATMPQLRFPAKIAVYFAHPDNGYRWGWWSIDWDENDKSQLLSLKSHLGPAGIVSDMFIVSDTVVFHNPDQPVGLQDIRLAAARYHADAVLIIRGVADTDRYSNFLSIAYLTILGFWVVPGSNCDAIFIADAVLLDVGNEYLYLTAQSESTDGVVQPAATLKESVPVQRAKRKAVALLVQELEKRFRNLKGSSAENSQP